MTILYTLWLTSKAKTDLTVNGHTKQVPSYMFKMKDYESIIKAEHDKVELERRLGDQFDFIIY